MPTKSKGRYFLAVLYPENMRPMWQDEIGDLLGYPFAYCIHDKDKTKEGEQRKVHVHMILAFPNTTTIQNAMNIFSKLSADGKKALNKIEIASSVVNAYNYLIHDTESCRKLKKHLYDKTERITGNNFDIGDYEQISTADKDRMLKEMCDYIIDNQITNFADMYIRITQDFDTSYFAVLKSYSGLLERLTRGVFLHGERSDKLEKQHEQRHENHHEICPFCNSAQIIKSGKTSINTQRFKCKDCGKTFTR